MLQLFYDYVRQLFTVKHQHQSDAELTALASEEALGRIWNDPAEDEAWAHL